MNSTRDSVEGAARFSMFRVGLLFGAILAITTTIRGDNFASQAFFKIDFLKLLLLCTFAGGLLGYLWGLVVRLPFVERICLTRADEENPAESRGANICRGGLEFGLPIGLFAFVQSVLDTNGFSANPFSYWNALLLLVYLLVFFFVGSVFGFVMFHVSKTLRVDRPRDEN